MEVILKEDVQGTGKKGDLVKVSDGYAKNFLLRRGLAVVASAQAMNEMKSKHAAAEHKIQREKDDAGKIAADIADKTIKIAAKAGESGKLFGSVTSKEVADALKEQLKVDVDKRKIVLESDIKTFGTYTAEVKIYPGISAKVFVVVGEQG